MQVFWVKKVDGDFINILLQNDSIKIKFIYCMHTEVTQSRRKSKNNKSPTSRGNFSQSGKLFDQTFYIESGDTNFLYKKVEFECSPRKSPRQATTAFTSVSRDIRPNIRFSSPVGEGEFRHKPNHFYGRNKSPSWSFPKK